ncbi:MAG: nicotinate (nicotinamide) nucleotide adenylyltransferase [Phycisphaerales bacterium]|nr:nicotinate (nicotinamide) nucleotide adenylyltransferase [Phycisphaerales bacterium]
MTTQPATPLPETAMSAHSVLVFGGSFDPPHRAHVLLPMLARERLGCDVLLYTPTAVSPFKQDCCATPAAHRVAMLGLALADHSEAAIWTQEVDRGGVNYTVDTLAVLRSLVGLGTEIRLLIGADQARSFHRWRHPGKILALCKPAVMLRPPDDLTALREALLPHWSDDEISRWMSLVVRLPAADISSTDARRRIERGEDVSDVLDPRVAEYISEHRLYGGDEAGIADTGVD